MPAGLSRAQRNCLHRRTWKTNWTYYSTRLDRDWSIDGTSYCITSFANGPEGWWLIPSYYNCTTSYPDIGPYPTLTAAAVAATLLDEGSS